MQLLTVRALLLLGLLALLADANKGQAASMKLRRGRRVRLVLDPSVQPQVAHMSASSIANMSLTPWKWRESSDGSRFPSRIAQAQCLTSGCLSPQGGEDAALVAKPIYYQVLVLHRVPRQMSNKNGGRKRRNKQDFQLGTEVITVGCTCVRPSVVPQLTGGM